MTFEGEQRVVPEHATAVVDDADQPPPAAVDLHAKVGGTRVERVLEQFLDHGSRTLDYLSGGDLVSDDVGQDSDTTHGNSSVNTKGANSLARAAPRLL